MMSSFTHGTDLLSPSSSPSYCRRIVSMCKALRQGEIGTPFPMLCMCSGFSASSLRWSYLSVRSALPFKSLNVLVSLASRVGRLSMSHAACKSVLVQREDCLEAWCLDCWQGGSKTCMKWGTYCWVDMQGNDGAVEGLWEWGRNWSEGTRDKTLCWWTSSSWDWMILLSVRGEQVWWFSLGKAPDWAGKNPAACQQDCLDSSWGSNLGPIYTSESFHWVKVLLEES